VNVSIISVIMITAACFFAAVLNLAMENRFKKHIMSAFTAIAVVMGILIYGYGFAFALGASPAAVLRALLAACKMFGGANDLSAIEGAPLFAHGWATAVFWLVHFMAFYVTASAAIAAVGGKVLRRIRVMRLHRGTLVMIYGVNDSALEYGREQAKRPERSVMFVTETCGAQQENAIHAMGAVLEKGLKAPDAAFLRRMGMHAGKRRMEAATLHEDDMKNLAFAQNLLSALKSASVHPQQTALLMRSADEENATGLMASEGAYGYGSVLVFDEYELAARLMVQRLAPCETIEFDGDAKAKQDFAVLMIGFGRMGRAALEQLVMNGQFFGSTFRADIFDADAQNGVLYDHEMLRQYDVRFHAASGRSQALYAFLAERLQAVRYIVLCTGSDRENREIAQDIGRWMKAHGASPAIVQCSKEGIAISRTPDSPMTYQRVYGSDVLDMAQMDRMAMIINQRYCGGSGMTAAQNWMRCDYFSRMSSRASADFYPAVLRASGRTAQQVMAGDWPPHDEAFENLAITEHLRWCAFHIVMGFRPMTDEEYDRRAAQYRDEVQKTGASSLRIGKNLAARRHACLIEWDELDALSEKENAVTGGQVDYKQLDRSSVLALPEILLALDAQEHKGEKTA